MLATDLISKLQRLIEQHGDQVVMDEYGNVIDEPEWNNDDGACFLVSFSEDN